MKKGQIIIIILLLCSLILIPVKADTGFDSSYSSSDSDFSSSSSSSSSYGDGEFDTVDFIVFALIFGTCLSVNIGVVLIIVLDLSRKNKPPQSDIPDEYLMRYGICDKNLLKNEFFVDFVDLQEAWMKFDYLTLQRLCTDVICIEVN